MKKLLFSLLSLFCCVSIYAQSAPPNLPHYDDKTIHFGCILGYNRLFSNMIEKENRPYLDTVMGFDSERSNGFQLGFIGDLRLCEYLRLRFLPSIIFSDRRLNYYIDKNGKYIESNVPMEVIYVEAPLEFKIQSKRWRNFRPYLIAGGKFSYDLASIKRKKASPDEILMKVNNSEWFYTLGVGFDFYLNYIKLGIEIKSSYGLNDILVHGYKTMYSDVLDKVKTQIFYINFTFE